MNEPMAKALAKWWADRMRSGEGNATQEQRAHAQLPCPEVGADIFAMARKAALKHPERIDMFEQELIRLLIHGPDAETHRYLTHQWPTSFVLYNDWDPQGLLARAVKLSGVPEILLPPKTQVHVYKNVAVVTEGEDQGLRLWPEPRERVTHDQLYNLSLIEQPAE